jgi:hypothetical protein
MNLDDCIRHAIEFVRVTTGPLFTQFDPEKLGEYSRALSVGEEYGNRLLRRFPQWDEEGRRRVIRRLVYSYPSHDYIIDYSELRDMEFRVGLFGDGERASVAGLLEYLRLLGEESLVLYCEPDSNVQQGTTTRARKEASE